MLIIGLTGGIGSGKTCVSNLFKDLGTPIIDTDVISREIVDNDQSVKDEIIKQFGDDVADVTGDVTTGNKNINRKQLAQIIFSDESARRKLEGILHPKIRADVNAQLKRYRSQNSSPRYIIVVVPLLLETKSYDFIDRVLVITALENTRIQRIVQRDNRNMDEIQSIISSQLTDESRISEADDIIENNDKLGDLATQVKELHEKYSALSDLSK